MPYEAWRITYQSSEQAARAAHAALQSLGARITALEGELAAAPQACSRWPEKLGETCMDGGTCHHDCEDKCFRRECCEPLTKAMNEGLTMEQWRYLEAAPQEDAIAEIVSASHDSAEFGERGINFLRDFQHLEYGTKLYPAPAAPQAVQAAEPGWKVVPVKPTPEMTKAGDAKTWVLPSKDCWEAMLAAAPAHPAEGVPAQAVPEIDERAAFDDFFRKRNRLHPDTDTTFRSDAAEPWKYWKARAALAATQPAAQGMDAKHELRKAIERLATASFNDEAARSPLGRFALSTCAASLPIAFGVESFVTALEAQEMLDAAIAAQAKQGGAE